MNRNLNNYNYINIPPDEIGTKWNLMHSLLAENEELAERVSPHQKVSSIPTADIIEHNGYFLLEVELPGFKKSNILVELDKSSVKISAKKYKNYQIDGALFLSDRHKGHYVREILFPCMINIAEAEANFGNGLLSLVLPKLRETTIRPIKIQFQS